MRAPSSQARCAGQLMFGLTTSVMIGACGDDRGNVTPSVPSTEVPATDVPATDVPSDDGIVA